MVISNQNTHGKGYMVTTIYIPLRLAIDLDFVILTPLFREFTWAKDRKTAPPESLSLRYENSGRIFRSRNVCLKIK